MYGVYQNILFSNKWGKKNIAGAGNVIALLRT